MSNNIYSATTNHITVEAHPFYMQDESEPENHNFFWGYRIVIINQGQYKLQLRERYWKIIDELGQVEEGRGRGVVGEEPILAPNSSYEYTSGCPLKVPSGVMSGYYIMECENGETLQVQIPSFSLDLPQATHTLN
jgi:ApaG protein